jgi:hypothetical protein
MQEALPGRHAAIVFWDRPSAAQWQAMQSAERTLGLRLAGIELVCWLWTWGIPGIDALRAHAGDHQIICDRVRPLAAFGQLSRGVTQPTSEVRVYHIAHIAKFILHQLLHPSS